MLAIGHFDAFRSRHALRLSMDKLEGSKVTHTAVSIHDRLLLNIGLTFRLLMSVFVVPEVPHGCRLLVLTIACGCRPGELEWQNKQHEDQGETSHFGAKVRGSEVEYCRLGR
nr:hypothetical protein [Cupriavidus basilensis]